MADPLTSAQIAEIVEIHTATCEKCVGGNICVEGALLAHIEAREQEISMGHVRLDECAAKAPAGSLYDRISWHIERLCHRAEEAEQTIKAIAFEADELRAKANAAEARRSAAEHRATRIELDKELVASLAQHGERIQQLLSERFSGECEIQPHMSRVCERGTSACVTKHRDTFKQQVERIQRLEQALSKTDIAQTEREKKA